MVRVLRTVGVVLDEASDYKMQFVKFGLRGAAASILASTFFFALRANGGRI